MDQNGGAPTPTTPLRKVTKVPPPVPKKPKVMTPAKRGEGDRLAGAGDGANPLLRVQQEELESCDDLTRLPVLYDDTVLCCVRARYLKGNYYTWAGPTLVAANPCRLVPHLYTPAIINHHHSQVKSGVDRRDAHVYSVAGVAHHRLTHGLGSVNQAILVSGESGAGKTESARYMLGYLSHVETQFPLVPQSLVSGNGTGKAKKRGSQGLEKGKGPERIVQMPKDIQGRILASNPILEAFGNASTLRNHNSSRFGKLICLQYGGWQLRGAEIDTYLLEKTRVTHQPAHERNFHIFYQVLAGIKSGYIEDFGIRSCDQFAIAPKGTLDTDLENFKETLEAFWQLDFPSALQKQIFQTIVALLHLGNVRFIQDQDNRNAWTVSRRSAEDLGNLVRACELLGLEEDKLVETLTIRTISVGTARRVSVFHKPCESGSHCVERRDALIQLVYQSLFIHIVSFINGQVSAARTTWSHFLGVLDVYGFETFGHNSLEQLCINYANERLQQAFMMRYLATEHQVLKEEGFLDVDVAYTDNTNCVIALDSPISVFAILNEECQLKREVREDEACERVVKALEDSGVVTAPTSPRKKAGFVVRHYAGPVKYSAEGLLHKNKDEVPIEVRSLLASSTQDFIGNLQFETEDIELESGRRTTRKITTLAKFKSSLDTLMKTLTQCDLHYVRCLKPNSESLPGRPEGDYLLHQLRACGIIETVCVSQAGYPIRISYEDFILRYGQPNETDVVKATVSIAESILGKMPQGTVDAKKCRFGRTRMFLSESALHTLEVVRERNRAKAATCLQKRWRGYKCVQRFKVLRRATMILQKHGKSFIVQRRYQRMREASIVIQKYLRRFIALRRYRQIARVTVTLQRCCRGWLARQRYETLSQQSLMRPYSRQSLTSLGYCSLSTSVSTYSLNPSLHDISPHDLDSIAALRGDVLRAYMSPEHLKTYMSPEHRKRLLETEESGIETDTESINGDADSETRRPRRRRRRAQLHQLGERRRSRLLHTASDDESLADASGSHISPSSGTEYVDKRPKPEPCQKLPAGPEPTLNDKSMRNNAARNVAAKDEPFPKLRVATMRNFQEMSSIIKESSPHENLQMVLPKQNLSLFFKDGVLSYRHMPLVKIKFHTRHTCLPFSHHLPHHERPQGLWDAMR